MKKSLLVLGMLFASSVMAAKSQFPCDILLFDGTSVDKGAQLIVCKSKERMSVTLVNLKKDKIVIDQRTSFDQAAVLYKDDNSKVFVWTEDEDDEDAKAIGYTEIPSKTDKVARILVIDPDGAKPIYIPMDKPKYDRLDRSLKKYGVEIGEVGLDDE